VILLRVFLGLVLHTVRALGPNSIVLTRGVANLHKPLCACADRLAGVSGPSAGTKFFGQGLCVFAQMYYELSGVSAWTIMTPRWRTDRPWIADNLLML
jgi:hypothetical protein